MRTFATKTDAEGWLAAERRLFDAGRWTPPAQRVDSRAGDELTLSDWATSWMAERQLRATTRDGYERLLKNHIEGPLGDLPLTALTKARIRTWYLRLDPSTPRARAKAYSLLRTILNGAIEAELMDGPNPCQIRGAGVSNRAHKIEPLTLDQLEALQAAMPERLRLAVLLGCWGALRYGELAELRRKDINAEAGIVKVRRGVTWTKGVASVGPPKTSAGIRDVHLPPFLIPTVKDHLRLHAQRGADGLLFPSAVGAHMWAPTFAKYFRKAKEAAGRPDLRVHDLRHTGAVLAAQTGATLAELMARLGHTTPAMAMRYQHAAAGADQRIAERLGQLKGEQ